MCGIFPSFSLHASIFPPRQRQSNDCCSPDREGRKNEEEVMTLCFVSPTSNRRQFGFTEKRLLLQSKIGKENQLPNAVALIKHAMLENGLTKLLGKNWKWKSNSFYCSKQQWESLFLAGNLLLWGRVEKGQCLNRRSAPSPSASASGSTCFQEVWE